MDQASKANDALAAGDFSSAISLYTEALKTFPQAPDYYVKRSTAFIRLTPPNYEASLRDAECAVVYATNRAKRELIAQAQLRRAVALFGLEKWGDARICLGWSQKLNEKEKSLAIWLVKTEQKLKGLGDDDERSKVNVKEVPDIETSKISEQVEPSDTGKSKMAAIAPTSATKIRHDWYQSPDLVTVTLFAKAVSKEKASVTITESSIEVSFPLPSGSEFHFSLDPLFLRIDPASSSYKIMSTKIEFQLVKERPGVKWTSLEATESSRHDAPTRDIDATSEAVKRAVLAEKTANTGPAYPTSSKSGPKNWDKVVTDLTKKPTTQNKDGESDATKDESIVDDDDEDSDPVNGFFKKLYQGADPDTRRAMMKSYQESNGTALSTNWAEVGKGPVETSPPDGMEARKW